MSRFNFALFCAALLVSTSAFADHAGVNVGPGRSGAILTTSAGTLPQAKISVGLSTEYIKSKRFSDAQLVEFASQHIHAHSTDYMVTTAVNAAYGITDDLMISVRVPYIYREGIRGGSHVHGGGGTVSNSVDDDGDKGAPGDALLLGKYRFLQSQWFDASGMLGIEMPTGTTGDTRDGEKLEAENQGGSGSWDPVFGLAVSRSFGPYTVDTSVVYKWATPGAQDADLGDRASYGIAITRRLGGELHDHGHGEIHTHEAWDLVLELNGEWFGEEKAQGRRDTDGGGAQAFISPGIRYTSDAGWNAYVSVGVPVRHDLRRGHPDSDIKATAGIGFSF